jgi:porphobilinogen deaminase
VQIRARDAELRARLAPLDDLETRLAVTSERELLRLMGASCEIPLGAIGRYESGVISLDAALAGDDGIRRAMARGSDPKEVARGAADILGAPAHV